jgi:hypothetical protein
MSTPDNSLEAGDLFGFGIKTCLKMSPVLAKFFSEENARRLRRTDQPAGRNAADAAITGRSKNYVD